MKKMLKKSKKGFTLVELVVVIAVIAILGGVSIAAYLGITNKANESNDVSLVTQLNTALIADKIEHSHPTMTEALKVAKNEGYDLTKIKASAKDNEILWDRENDLFCYYRGGKMEYYPSQSHKENLPDVNFWVVKDSVHDNFSTYYIGSEKVFTGDNAIHKGFDVGEITDITAIEYNNSAAQEVVIRTNSYDTILAINAPADTVKHYDKANKINVEAVAMHSYHEFGDVIGNINLEKGSVVVEEGCKASAIVIDATAAEIEAGTVTVSANNTPAPYVPIIVNAEVEAAIKTKAGDNAIISRSPTDVIVVEQNKKILNRTTNTYYDDMQEALNSSGELLLLDDITCNSNLDLGDECQIKVLMNDHTLNLKALNIYQKNSSLIFEGTGELLTSSQQVMIYVEGFNTDNGKQTYIEVGRGIYTNNSYKDGRAIGFYGAGYLSHSGGDTSNCYGVELLYKGTDESKSSVVTTNGQIHSNKGNILSINIINAKINSIGYLAGFSKFIMEDSIISGEGNVLSAKAGDLNFKRNVFNIDISDSYLGYDYAWANSGAFSQNAVISLEEGIEGYGSFTHVLIDSSNIFNYIGGQKGQTMNDVFHMLNGNTYGQKVIEVDVKYATDADFAGYIAGTMFGGSYQIKLYFTTLDKMNNYKPSDLEEQQGVSTVVFNKYYIKQSDGSYLERE